MNTIAQRTAALFFSLVLAGCVAGQSLRTGYEQAAAAEPGTNAAGGAGAVEIEVTDDREYVRSGDKPPHYLGKYRAGFGNPWNVSTENDEPLATILARDLAADLTSLGYDVKPAAAAERKLAVSIKDWNFDGYQNGRMWYDLRVSVTGRDGKVVATDEVREETKIKGTFWMGARGGFEREMPKLYAQAIRKIARDNGKITAALSSGRP